MYFPKLNIILPALTMLYFSSMQSFLIQNYEGPRTSVKYFPKLNMFYFAFLLICTSLHHNVKLPIMRDILFMQNYEGLYVYFPRIDISFFQSYWCVLPDIIMLYFPF
jgi:hypothetical protein